MPAVKVSPIGAGSPQSLYSGPMAGITARTDDIVDRQSERLAQRREGSGVPVNEFLEGYQKLSNAGFLSLLSNCY